MSKPKNYIRNLVALDLIVSGFDGLERAMEWENKLPNFYEGCHLKTEAGF